MKDSWIKRINLFSLLPGLGLIIIAGLMHSNIKKPPIVISKQDSAINFNAGIQYLNLDLKRMIASMLWVATLIEGDVEHYKKRDLNSWMFHRFKLILHLDPYFKEGYQYGAQYLSIVKDDILGATYIYEKGLEKYPDDFFLNYQAAIHFFNEAGEVAKAIPLLEKVKDNSRSPSYIKSLIETLRLKAGISKEEVLKNLYHLREQTQDPNLIQLYDIRINKLKKEIQ
jgi:hypothetical protein